MLKFDPENYPPTRPEDVEFTDSFVNNHRYVPPSIMARLIVGSLTENMTPEDRPKAPEIMAHLIETFPIVNPEMGISSQLYGPNPKDQSQFIVSIEHELGQRLPLKLGAS